MQKLIFKGANICPNLSNKKTYKTVNKDNYKELLTFVITKKFIMIPTIKYFRYGTVILMALLSISTYAKKKPIQKKKPIFANETNEIHKVLNMQQKAWNEGNIAEYMQGYWMNDSLIFVGKKGVTHGWNNTLANYKKAYPDKNAMGNLTLDILSVNRISKDAAFVVGKWNLERNIGNINGHFTLLMRKKNNKWVIVADHSS